MKRRFRLRRSTEFQRVRRLGRSHAHPLIVLVLMPNQQPISRFGISAGRSLGKAVRRNRAKRLIRAALQPMIPNLAPGWDAILVARRGMAEASLDQTGSALTHLFQRAGLLAEK